MIRILLIMGAFLTCYTISFAGYNYNESCQRCYQAVISLRFGEARRLIEQEKIADPENLIPVYLDNYIDCLSLFISEDPVLFHYLKEKRAQRISLLENGPVNSPFYRFCLAQVYLQWAFARLKFDEVAIAAIEIRKAFNLLKENQELFPDFALNNTGLGIVHVTLGLIPEKYRWFPGLLGMDGTMAQGISEIRQVALYSGPDKLYILYRMEAAFYLTFITINLNYTQGETKAVLNVLDEIERNAVVQSPLLIYARASILMKTGKNDEAIRVLNTRKALENRYQFLYLDYLEGVARLNNLDFSSAELFETYLKRYKGHNYIFSATQRLSWIAFLKGDTVQYNMQLSGIQHSTIPQVDEDKQAASESKMASSPNYYLLRARLLFDGGYYDRALDELLDRPVKEMIKTKKEVIEYAYRLGRIQQENGNPSSALVYYQQVITNGQSQPYYYAAAAALQMGLVYENKGLWANAEASFRLCLSIETPEYKTSLRQKAKVGLERVRLKLKSHTEGG